jgi:NADH dehydrogenase [ubiquinone] 1 alpha subcomplex assembly factor 5
MFSWFDQDLLQRRMMRRFANWSHHDFLYRKTADMLRDRLLDIKRDFPHVLDIGWQPYVVDASLQKLKKIQQVDPVSPFSASNGILPITPCTYDAVISHLVLPFADEPQMMLQQYFFALKPDGVFGGCTLGMESLHELRSVLSEAEQDIYGGVSPRVLPMLDVQSLAGMMQQTGFALPVVDYDRVTVTYADLKSLLADLRGLGQTNVLLQRRRQPLSKSFWQRAEEIYRQRFADERGRLVVTLDVIYLLGWAPHPSQPQPKARGSATVQLGEALKR